MVELTDPQLLSDTNYYDDPFWSKAVHQSSLLARVLDGLALVCVAEPGSDHVTAVSMDRPTGKRSLEDVTIRIAQNGNVEIGLPFDKQDEKSGALELSIIKRCWVKILSRCGRSDPSPSMRNKRESVLATFRRFAVACKAIQDPAKQIPFLDEHRNLPLGICNITYIRHPMAGEFVLGLLSKLGSYTRFCMNLCNLATKRFGPDRQHLLDNFTIKGVSLGFMRSTGTIRQLSIFQESRSEAAIVAIMCCGH